MKLLIAILTLLFLVVQYRLWFGEGGLHEIKYQQSQVDEQKAFNLRLQERNDALRANVEDLNEGKEALEGHARSDLGMIKQGETFYQVVGLPGE